MLRRFRFWIDDLTTREALLFGAKLAAGLIVISALSKTIFGGAQIPGEDVRTQQKVVVPVKPDPFAPQSQLPSGTVTTPANQPDKSKELFEQTEPVKTADTKEKEGVSVEKSNIKNGVNAAISLFGPLADSELENPDTEQGSNQNSRADKQGVIPPISDPCSNQPKPQE